MWFVKITRDRSVLKLSIVQILRVQTLCLYYYSTDMWGLVTRPFHHHHTMFTRKCQSYFSIVSILKYTRFNIIYHSSISVHFLPGSLISPAHFQRNFTFRGIPTYGPLMCYLFDSTKQNLKKFNYLTNIRTLKRVLFWK